MVARSKWAWLHVNTNVQNMNIFSNVKHTHVFNFGEIIIIMETYSECIHTNSIIFNTSNVKLRGQTLREVRGVETKRCDK